MDVFIARQPIFDNSKNLIAYELLYRDHEGATCFGGCVDGSMSLGDVLLHRFFRSLETEWA